MRTRSAVIVSVVAVLGLLVACGDDSPVAPTPPPPPPPPPVATPQELTVHAPQWFADSLELEVGQEVQLSANITMSDGAIQEGVDAEWMSSNTVVATISADGLLTGRQPGGFDLRATAEWGSRRASQKYALCRSRYRGAHQEPARRFSNLPTRITRIRIEGEYTGSSENFVIWCGIGGDRGGLLVNEILGTRRSTHYSGIHSARRSYGNAGDPCRELQVEHSQGIRWTITETSPRSALSPAASTGSAFGDEEAVRRAREQRNQF